MTEQPNQPPTSELPPEQVSPEPPDAPEPPRDEAQPPSDIGDNQIQEPSSSSDNGSDQEMDARLERLGGEPAPDITPEEFARLQQSGQIHIDPRGRVRSRVHRSTGDAGVSLRKRRAWYR